MGLKGIITIIKRDGEFGGRVEVTDLRTYIGRNLSCDIRINHPRCADRHALIWCPDDSQPKVTSLGFKAETFLNGDYIGSIDRWLYHADVIRVAGRELIWEYPEDSVYRSIVEEKRRREPGMFSKMFNTTPKRMPISRKSESFAAALRASRDSGLSFAGTSKEAGDLPQPAESENKLVTKSKPVNKRLIAVKGAIGRRSLQSTKLFSKPEPKAAVRSQMSLSVVSKGSKKSSRKSAPEKINSAANEKSSSESNELVLSLNEKLTRRKSFPTLKVTPVGIKKSAKYKTPNKLTSSKSASPSKSYTKQKSLSPNVLSTEVTPKLPRNRTPSKKYAIDDSYTKKSNVTPIHNSSIVFNNEKDATEFSENLLCNLNKNTGASSSKKSFEPRILRESKSILQTPEKGPFQKGKTPIKKSVQFAIPGSTSDQISGWAVRKTPARKTPLKSSALETVSDLDDTPGRSVIMTPVKVTSNNCTIIVTETTPISKKSSAEKKVPSPAKRSMSSTPVAKITKIETPTVIPQMTATPEKSATRASTKKVMLEKVEVLQEKKRTSKITPLNTASPVKVSTLRKTPIRGSTMADLASPKIEKVKISTPVKTPTPPKTPVEVTSPRFEKTTRGKRSTPAVSVLTDKKATPIQKNMTAATKESSSKKRKLGHGPGELDSVRAAKRLKVESPKSLDKKKQAALMATHGKGLTPSSALKRLVRSVKKRPLFSEVLKAKRASQLPPTNKQLPPLPTKPMARPKKNIMLEVKVKPSKSNSTGHANSPAPIIIGRKITKLLPQQTRKARKSQISFVKLSEANDKVFAGMSILFKTPIKKNKSTSLFKTPLNPVRKTANSGKKSDKAAKRISGGLVCDESYTSPCRATSKNYNKKLEDLSMSGDGSNSNSDIFDRKINMSSNQYIAVSPMRSPSLRQSGESEIYTQSGSPMKSRIASTPQYTKKHNSSSSFMVIPETPSPDKNSDLTRPSLVSPESGRKSRMSIRNYSPDTSTFESPSLLKKTVVSSDSPTNIQIGRVSPVKRRATKSPRTSSNTSSVKGSFRDSTEVTSSGSSDLNHYSLLSPESGRKSRMSIRNYSPDRGNTSTYESPSLLKGSIVSSDLSTNLQTGHVSPFKGRASKSPSAKPKTSSITASVVGAFRDSTEATSSSSSDLTRPSSLVSPKSGRKSLCMSIHNYSTHTPVRSSSADSNYKTPAQASGIHFSDNDSVFATPGRISATRTAVVSRKSRQNYIGNSSSARQSSRKTPVKIMFGEGDSYSSYSSPDSFPSSSIKRKNRNRSSMNVSFELLPSEITSFDFDAVNTPNVPKEIFVSPLSVSRKSIKNDLTNVAGIRQLMMTPGKSNRKSIKNDLTDVRGIRRLMSTPANSPVADYTNVKGVKRLMRAPVKSPVADYSNVEGVKQMMTRKSPYSSYIDVRGVKDLFVNKKQTSIPNLDSIGKLFDLPQTSKVFPVPIKLSPTSKASSLPGASPSQQRPIQIVSPTRSEKGLSPIKYNFSAIPSFDTALSVNHTPNVEDISRPPLKKPRRGTNKSEETPQPAERRNRMQGVTNNIKAMKTKSFGHHSSEPDMQVNVKTRVERLLSSPRKANIVVPKKCKIVISPLKAELVNKSTKGIKEVDIKLVNDAPKSTTTRVNKIHPTVEKELTQEKMQFQTRRKRKAGSFIEEKVPQVSSPPKIRRTTRAQNVVEVDQSRKELIVVRGAPKSKPKVVLGIKKVVPIKKGNRRSQGIAMEMKKYEDGATPKRNTRSGKSKKSDDKETVERRSHRMVVEGKKVTRSRPSREEKSDTPKDTAAPKIKGRKRKIDPKETSPRATRGLKGEIEPPKMDAVRLTGRNRRVVALEEKETSPSLARGLSDEGVTSMETGRNKKIVAPQKPSPKAARGLSGKKVTPEKTAAVKRMGRSKRNVALVPQETIPKAARGVSGKCVTPEKTEAVKHTGRNKRTVVPVANKRSPRATRGVKRGKSEIPENKVLLGHKSVVQDRLKGSGSGGQPETIKLEEKKMNRVVQEPAETKSRPGRIKSSDSAKEAVKVTRQTRRGQNPAPNSPTIDAKKKVKFSKPKTPSPSPVKTRARRATKK